MKSSPLLRLVIVCLILGTQTSFAQSQIRGRVLDDKNLPIAGATILLNRSSDSLFLKGGISDTNGQFLLDNIAPESYFINISLIGYEPFSVRPFRLEKDKAIKDFGTFTLHESTTQLQEVAVVAKKALFEQKIDRLVVNVAASSTSAGSTALEVLERSPGVVVNRQNNSIALAGKSGVVVMINGRQNYMTSEAAVQMLNGMSANSIETIEILATPPANMDAEGNAGYINIVLKKNENEGFNGSYSLSAGYGKGEVGGGSINTNYRKGKLNTFFNYDYNRQGQQQDMSFYRSIPFNGRQVETNNDILRLPTRNTNTARMGFDYQLDEKTTLGGLISGYKNHFMMDALANSTFSSNRRTDSLITTKLNEINLWQHIGGNLNVQHTFRANEALTFSTDYLYYDNSNPIDYVNRWSTPNGTLYKTQMLRSGKKTPITIAVAQLDYNRNLGKKAKMETGVKAVSSDFTNDISLESLEGTRWAIDPEFTAKYTLKERIFAAYSSFEVAVNPKIAAKAGLRYEYTTSNLGSLEQANIVDRKYGRLFPSLFLSRTISKESSLGVSYSRRITRPTFNELAPFVIFSDPNTYFAGNAALQPAISSTLKADYRFKGTLISLQYTHEDSTIASFQAQVKEGTNKQFSISSNLKNQKTLSLTISQSYAPTKWWSMYGNLAGIWQQTNAYYNDVPIQVEVPNLTVTTMQSFSFPKQVSLELTGYFNSGGLFGIFKLQPFGAANAALQKKFKKNGGNLSLGYDNIFNTMVFRSKADIPAQGQAFQYSLQFTQPTVKLTWTCPFGNQKMKTGTRVLRSEDERKRVQ